MKNARAWLLAVYLSFAALALLDMLLAVIFPGREMIVANMIFSEIMRLGGVIAGFIQGGF